MGPARKALPAHHHLGMVRMIISESCAASNRNGAQLGVESALEAAEAPSLRPIAVLFDGPGGLEVINLSLDTLPKTRGIGAALNAAQAFAAQVVSSSPRQVSPLLHLSSHALDAAVSIFTGAQTTELAQLARACEAAGLLLLANAVDRMGVRKDAESSLATAYLASEVAAGLKWA